MDRFSQQIAQLRDYLARPQIALALLVLGMLPGIALFQALGAQMMTSMLAGLAVGMLFLGACLSALAPAIWAPRRAALISAALLAYACGIHVVIYWLALPAPRALLFDKLAGMVILALAALAALAHSAWRATRTRTHGE